jgi:hypothetical protein
MKHEICNLFVMIINYWFSIWFTKDNFEIFLFFTISNKSVSIGNCEFFQEQSGTNKQGIMEEKMKMSLLNAFASFKLFWENYLFFQYNVPVLRFYMILLLINISTLAA